MPSLTPLFSSAPGQSAKWGIRRSDGMVFDFDAGEFVADDADEPPAEPLRDLTPSPTFGNLYCDDFDTSAILVQFPNGYYTFIGSFNGGAYFADYDDYVKDGSDNVPPGSLSLTEDDVDSIGVAAAAGIGGSVAEGVWANGTRTLTDKAGFALSAAGLDAVPGIGGMNARQQADFLAAFVFSIRTGIVAGQAGTATIKSIDGATTYGAITYDANGNVTDVDITKGNLP